MLDKKFWLDLEWRFDYKTPIPDLMAQIQKDVDESIENGYDDIQFWLGSDSQVYPKKGKIKYVVAIVMYRVSQGARIYFANKETDIPRGLKKQPLARVRLWNEVCWSVMVSDVFEPKLMELGYLVDEVHADVNEDKRFLSNEVMAAVLGYITSKGYVGKAKPDAYSASKAADRRLKKR